MKLTLDGKLFRPLGSSERITKNYDVIESVGFEQSRFPANSEHEMNIKLPSGYYVKEIIIGREGE